MCDIISYAILLVITNPLTCTDCFDELLGRHVLIGEGNGSDGGTRLMVDRY